MLKNTLLISIVLLLMGCTEEPELERRSGLDDDLDYLTSSQLVEKYGEVPAEQLMRYRSMFREQDHADKNYILYRADAIKIYDAETAFRDGMDYQFGNGKDQSYLRAKELYESAADLGSVKALFFLGIMYNFGYGVPPNIIIAREYYEKAANQNDIKSAYFMALSYEFRRDTNQAQYWYDRVTKVPYPLGDIIKDYDANSRFVSEAARDFSNGIDLYGEAANYGVEEAQFALSLLLNSHGEMQDYFSAKLWLDKLLEKGFPIAQFEVARMYLRGHGVRQDDEKAIYLYEQAAKQGHVKAMYALGDLLIQRPSDRQIAKEWYGKSCDSGLQDGCETYHKINSNSESGLK